MRKYLVLIVALFCVSYMYTQNLDLIKYVNTLQGSHNTPEFSHGRCSPLVGLPHGVNLWSPRGTGFSGGGILFTSLAGALVTGAGDADTTNVTAQPHYYKATFDNGMITEMTSTERCGYFKFTYPRTQQAYLVIKGSAGEFNINPEQRTITNNGQSYFVMEFDQPFVSYGKMKNKQGAESESDIYIEFRKGAKVQFKVSTSHISLEQAKTTFKREIGPYRFDEVKEATGKVWNELLNKIVVEGGTLEQKKTFYSCLYRANLRPAQNFEVDKEGYPHYYYKGKVYDGYYHSNPILWDAFRSLFPLQNILNTAGQKEYVKSLQTTKPLTGWWPSGHVMIGNHAISVFADAWAKGIRTFNPDTVLKYYYHEVTHSQLDVTNDYNIEHERGYGRMRFENYFTMGYIPYPQNTNRVMETTSRTLEYTYDDFCAYQLAKMTGNKFYEGLFKKHMFNYKNVFDPTDHFMKGRDIEGNWDTDFNPYEWGGAFVEGNGWQWKWSVFHDIHGFIDLVGGKEKFASELDTLFAVRADSVLFGGYGFMIHEINEAVAGGMGQYAGGNEPCFHITYLYDYVGQPWKCQKLIRTSLAQQFNSGPDGFPGDEDGGAMSSFYVFSAMGFYSVTPGVDQYAIGSPLFDKVTITLESGNKFTIIANENNSDNVYIHSATLNGKPYSKNWLSHTDIMSGGELNLKMSNQPNLQRGIHDKDTPFSVSKEF